ncbi:hypothetical protein GALMADRAFT_883348 [Galerina marginata CBS 339.88]|uniref:Uncharacterized protein n=1 Tax=Galerina marginata (strain CBS 339.88) TaxID=685588 RepID=A0A067SHE7_GALM3|nr:hypothetical protein GALMADRAFT_883348 [Galerina marginata CBS 339.88]
MRSESSIPGPPIHHDHRHERENPLRHRAQTCAYCDKTLSTRCWLTRVQKTVGVIVPLNYELKADRRLEFGEQVPVFPSLRHFKFDWVVVVVVGSLSEVALLGFDYGAHPNILLIWRPSLVNSWRTPRLLSTLSSSQIEWLRRSGVFLMLRHGLDGTGPEHSSAWVVRMRSDRHDVSSDPNNIYLNGRSFPPKLERPSHPPPSIQVGLSSL